MKVTHPEVYHHLPENVRLSVDFVLENLLNQRGIQGLIWGGSSLLGGFIENSDIDLWTIFENPKIAKSSFLSIGKSTPNLLLVHDAGALRWFGYLVTLFFSGITKFSIDVGFARILDILEINTGPDFHILWAENGVESQIQEGIQDKSYVLTQETHGGSLFSSLVKIHKCLLAYDCWNAFECLSRARSSLMGVIRDSKKNQIATYYQRPERRLSLNLSSQEEQDLALTVSDTDLENIKWASIRVANLFIKYTKNSLSNEMTLAIKELINSLSQKTLWPTTPISIGVVGVGRIGAGLLRHIVQFYEEVHAADIDSKRVKQAEVLGAAGSNLSTISQKCDIIILSLPNSESAESVLNEILKEPFPRKIIIDTSTNEVDQQVLAAKRCQEYGHAFIDAPLSGGPGGANEGTLAVMVGASDDDYRRVLPVLSTFGKKIIHVGPTGYGSMAKLIHNMVGEMQVHAFAEAFAVGSKAGVDFNALFKCMSSGMVSSRILTELYSKGILSDSETSNVTIDTAEKDQRFLLNFAKSLDLKLISTEIIHKRLIEMKNNDLGKSDVSYTMKWFEDNHGVSIDKDNIVRN